MKTENDVQSKLFDYVDQIKEILLPETWQNVLLNCTKNELFVLWFLYRQEEVNMTQIAEYIHVPLNTATGIISRMEKRGILFRNHSKKDKRVVTILLTEEGESQIQIIFNEISLYAKHVFDALTTEESQMLFEILNKVICALEEKPDDTKAEPKKIRKIVIE